MEGLPDFSIPTVLSFLRLTDICRCACIAKEWSHYAQQRRIEMKEESARTRAQVHQWDQWFSLCADLTKL